MRPGETRQGWLVFESVDWDALRGNVMPAESRLRVDVWVGGGLGTAEWLVDASGRQGEDPVRRVSASPLGASVTYMIM